ncbi:MAG TPA: glycosyltransferase family 4 protein [Gemmataceae bacterium]|nr:glycosyltransferase family 4 protein [Gemmataceae bacterium]
MTATRPRIGLFDLSPGHSGLTRYVFGLLDALPADEFAVTVFCHPRGPYQPRPNVRLCRIPVAGATGLAVQPGAVTGPVTRPGVRSRLWRAAVPRAVRYAVGYVREARRLAPYLRAEPVDLLHTNECGIMTSGLAARLAGVPRVLATYHTQSDYDRLAGRLTLGYRLLERATSRLLDQAVAVSEATRQDRIRTAWVPADRVATIHNGIDATGFDPLADPAGARAALGLPADRVLFGAVAQLQVYKGIDILLRAFATVAARHPQADLVIAGTGPLRNELEALAGILGLRDRVRFLGFQSDVTRVFAALDVYVLSSQCEALPYALLEAMAAGKPVVATTVGGVPEVIEPSVSGFLVPPDQADELAEALATLAASADLRVRYGHAARKRVETMFDQRASAERTIDLYRQALAGLADRTPDARAAYHPAPAAALS